MTRLPGGVPPWRHCAISGRRVLTWFATCCCLLLLHASQARAQPRPGAVPISDALAHDSLVSNAALSPSERAAIRDATGRIVLALERRESSWLGAAYGLQPTARASGLLAATHARAGGARPTVDAISEPEVLERGDTVRFAVGVRLRWVSAIGRTRTARLRIVATCVREGPRCTLFELEAHDDDR
jgi:hypothetical protein